MSGASAQQWARKMFKTTQHDFGAVARGSKAEFDFELQNIFEEEVHIASVRTNCTCTKPSITKNTLKTWEKGAIRATYNTRSFLGSKGATITVTIDKPYFAEVQLSVTGYIRSDVLFQPGNVEFGEVEEGQVAERMVSVEFAGRSDWRIVDVRSANPHFEVELGDPAGNFGRVSYKMYVRLKDDAPSGYLNDQLTVVTNDSRNNTLELTVEGRVVTPLSVSPASLFLGVLKPGETVKKRLFIKGNSPFRILAVKCANGGFAFEPSEKVDASHFIPVTFTAGNDPGKVLEKIEISTDLGNGVTATCLATATVLGADATGEDQ